MDQEEILEERAMPVSEYLAFLEKGSADYEWINRRSERLARIVVRKLCDSSGRRFEDTIFYEKSGVCYTVRTRLA